MRKGWVINSLLQQQEGRFPPDIRVKRGHSWSEQLGIAIACLCEKEERHFVEWTKEVLLCFFNSPLFGLKPSTVAETDYRHQAINYQRSGQGSRSRARLG